MLQTDLALTLKSTLNWLAAFLGIGTFLGIVNLAVGLLSAAWIAAQLYGYLRLELPMKRLRKQLLQRQLGTDADASVAEDRHP